MSEQDGCGNWKDNSNTLYKPAYGDGNQPARHGEFVTYNNGEQGIMNNGSVIPLNKD